MAARPLRILLVDDRANSAKAMARLLGISGHDVQSAASVADAAGSALVTPPDVLISDFDLPDGDGCELLRRIRTLHPAVRGIAVSGHADERHEAACRAAGYEVLLTKPVTFEQLLGVVDGSAD